jgi:5-methyltetrahydrofolate--homocysteine methyltransferase
VNLGGERQEENTMNNLLDRLVDAVAEGKAAVVAELVRNALTKGCTAGEVIDQGLMPGLKRVSEQFDGNIVYIPEVLLASRAVNAGMRALRLGSIAEPMKSRGKVIIGTVAGDLHDIGKSLAITFLEREGFKVVDLGVDVHPEEFVQAVNEYNPDVLAMSALLTTSIPMLGETVQALEKAGVRQQVKVVIGGSRIYPEYAESLKVDVHASDALAGARSIRRLL